MARCRQFPGHWADLARVTGGPVPYWPVGQRQPGEMLRWSPGDPPAKVPPADELNIAPLLRLAADLDDGSTPAQAVLHLANLIQEQAASRVRIDLEILETAGNRAAIALAATPVTPVRHCSEGEGKSLIIRRSRPRRSCRRLSPPWCGGASWLLPDTDGEKADRLGPCYATSPTPGGRRR